MELSRFSVYVLWECDDSGWNRDPIYRETEKMAFYTIKRILLLFVIFSAGLAGCSRHRPTSLDQLSIYRQVPVLKTVQPVPKVVAPEKNTTRAFTPFEELVVSLVFDALDLLPNAVSSTVYDVIANGMDIPDQSDEIDKNILTSSRKADIALVAGQIVHLVYGENVGTETVIPQAILFVHSKIAFSDIATLKSRLSLSEHRNLDAYNTCLNLLANVLSDNYGVRQKNREGLYLRDSKNNLYFHKGMNFKGTSSN